MIANTSKPAEVARAVSSVLTFQTTMATILSSARTKCHQSYGTDLPSFVQNSIRNKRLKRKQIISVGRKRADKRRTGTQTDCAMYMARVTHWLSTEVKRSIAYESIKYGCWCCAPCQHEHAR